MSLQSPCFSCPLELRKTFFEHKLDLWNRRQLVLTATPLAQYVSKTKSRLRWKQKLLTAFFPELSKLISPHFATEVEAVFFYNRRNSAKALLGGLIAKSIAIKVNVEMKKESWENLLYELEIGEKSPQPRSQHFVVVFCIGVLNSVNKNTYR